MLVRRDVWDALGGPDPALAHARDDLDLCRRAHLAGHRVIVVPGAVVAHAEAGPGVAGRSAPRGRGPGPTGATPSICASPPHRVRDAGGARLDLSAALLRAAGRLALKQPDRAVDELAPIAAVLVTADGLAAGPPAHPRAPPGVGRARPPAAGSAAPGGAGPPGRVSAHLRRQEAAWLAAEVARARTAPDTAARDPVVETRPGQGEAEEAETAGRVRAAGRRPAPLLVVTAVVLPAALAGLSGCAACSAGRGVAASPALLPAPADAARSLAGGTSTWRAVGLGVRVARSAGAVLAVLAAPSGLADTAVLSCCVAALPLSRSPPGRGRGVTRSRALRAWAALVWAAAPAC